MRLNSASRFQQTNVESFKKIYKGNRELFSKKTFKEGEERLETKDGYVVYLETLKDNSQVIKAVPAGEFKKQEKLLLKKSQELLKLLQAPDAESKPQDTQLQKRKVRPHSSAPASTKAPARKPRITSAPAQPSQPAPQTSAQPSPLPRAQSQLEQQPIPQTQLAPKPAPRTAPLPHTPPVADQSPEPPTFTIPSPPLSAQTSVASTTPPTSPNLSRESSLTSGFGEPESPLLSSSPLLSTSSSVSSSPKASQKAPSTIATQTPATSRTTSVTESVTDSEFSDFSTTSSEQSETSTSSRRSVRETEQERNQFREATTQETIKIPPAETFADPAVHKQMSEWSDQLKQQCDQALKKMACHSREEEQALRTMLYAGLVSSNPGLKWPLDYYGNIDYGQVQIDQQALKAKPPALVRQGTNMIRNHQKYLSTHNTEQDRSKAQGRSFFDVLWDQQAEEKPKITKEQIMALQEFYQKQQQQVFEYYLAHDPQHQMSQAEWNQRVERELAQNQQLSKVEWMRTKTDAELTPEAQQKNALANHLPERIRKRLTPVPDKPSSSKPSSSNKPNNKQ